jgi:putative pyruvate formate lyase activating enzyme
MDEFISCNICPRNCNINRYEKKGYCNSGPLPKVSKAYLHRWEEPCISGERGSGAVFFSGCSMGCIFCQNNEISHDNFGAEISVERLGEIYLELQDKGAHNINLVTPTHYVPVIRDSLQLAEKNGLSIPVIYNCGGYEKTESLKTLEGLVDIYLPDIKYYSDKYSIKYSRAPGYFKYASAAVLEMVRQVGMPQFKDSMLTKGVMIRHMMLPGLLFDSKKIVDWVAQKLPEDIYLNLMCQYTPMFGAEQYPEINRRVSPKCYDALVDYALNAGIKNGFIQEYESASEKYVPLFNLEGVEKVKSNSE